MQAHPHVEMLHIDDAQRKDPQARLQLMQDSDMTILCLPDEAARDAVALAEGDASIRFIDASTAHRVDSDWVYGFPEMTATQRGMIASASRIANPGCYPTGFLALAKPLIASGMLPADSRLSVPAVSGYSGGGKSMIGAHDSGELAPQFSYGTSLSHKHLAEMTHYAGLTTPPIFMPSVGDFYAGMLVHLPLHADQFAGAVEANQLYQLYADWYAAAPLVRMGRPVQMMKTRRRCWRLMRWRIPTRWKFLCFQMQNPSSFGWLRGLIIWARGRLGRPYKI